MSDHIQTINLACTGKCWLFHVYIANNNVVAKESFAALLMPLMDL